MFISYSKNNLSTVYTLFQSLAIMFYKTADNKYHVIINSSLINGIFSFLVEDPGIFS